MARFEGPLESGAAFPDTLTARVVTPGAAARIHGYDIESDLARHYLPSDVTLLLLTGELPEPSISSAFAVALVFLAPVSVAHAATHAAVLGQLCGAPAASVFGVAAIGVAEHARFLVAEHAELVAWLHTEGGSLPQRYQSETQDDVEAVQRLKAALAASGVHVPGLSLQPSRNAALVMLLFTCGLKLSNQLEAALTLARLPSAIAEALAERPTNFANYPINLPRFVYSVESV
jgi:hypothetical protein